MGETPREYRSSHPSRYRRSLVSMPFSLSSALDEPTSCSHVSKCSLYCAMFRPILFKNASTSGTSAFGRRAFLGMVANVLAKNHIGNAKTTD